MNYNTSLLIMVLVIMAGLYFSPVVGGALLAGALFAVACTWGKHRHTAYSDDIEIEASSEPLSDHVGYYEMDNCTCGERKFASSPLCYRCSHQRKG